MNVNKCITLKTTTGAIIPLVDVAGISEEDIDTEGFLEYKLSKNALVGENYIYVLSIHGEYHQIDVRDAHNTDQLRPEVAITEYLYEATLKKILYAHWVWLREQNKVVTQKFI